MQVTGLNIFETELKSVKHCNNDINIIQLKNYMFKTGQFLNIRFSYFLVYVEIKKL